MTASIDGELVSRWLPMGTIQQLADAFCRAFYDARWPKVEPPEVDGLSLDDAYRVQERVTEKRVARGERVVGYKVGCTSAAIRKQFGLQEPIYGRLFAPHTGERVGPVDPSAYANCAIEPEMVIRTAKPLRGERVTDEELIDAIDVVRPGVELHHYTFYKTPATTQELICSGGLHAGVVIGDEGAPPGTLTFSDEEFSVWIDGELIACRRASEIMGGPLHSLRWLVSKLTRNGSMLEAGSLVIPGSPTELVTIDRTCRVQVRIDRVGQVTVPFVISTTL